ncbi:hypothetical protein LINGRAHAP2_LOCUS33721 [Linum grandiflorum]
MEGMVKMVSGASKRMYKVSTISDEGIVTGVATCYTNKAPKCRACLEEAKAKLGRCDKSTGGAVFADYCNMVFWKVVVD